jgi:hypothetical protein
MTTTESEASEPAPGLVQKAGRTAQRALVIGLSDKRMWLLIIFILVIGAGAQAIGVILIPIGIVTITLLPMIWGLIAGAVVSGQTVKRMPIAIQDAATVIMGVAVLGMCAWLSFTIGPNVPLVIKAGPALLLQEVGHLFGTLVLALPLAVLLRMGPATIGATFSVDREGSFGIVSGKYGANSPQYRGVLSMYVFGTVFGAVIVAIVTSLTESLHIFSPLALAMGSGVGSGSMMAAAAGVIGDAHPALKTEVLALAATSNLITGALGTYVGVWVSLPLADRFYRLLTRNKDAQLPGQPDRKPTGVLETQAVPAVTQTVFDRPNVKVPLWLSLTVFSVAGIVVEVVADHKLTWQLVVTYLIVAVLIMAGMGLSRLCRNKVPPIIFVMTIGILLTLPFSPVEKWLVTTTSSVTFVVMITAVLTIAGLSLGKDLPMLKNIGWKIIPVGIVAVASSFIFATIVAEFALGLWR